MIQLEVMEVLVLQELINYYFDCIAYSTCGHLGGLMGIEQKQRPAVSVHM